MSYRNMDGQFLLFFILNHLICLILNEMITHVRWKSYKSKKLKLQKFVIKILSLVMVISKSE